eukprot:gene9129-11185_t
MSAIDQQKINEIEQCLRGLLDPNLVATITPTLNKLLKPQISSVYLLHHLQNSQFIEIRQLSAILLRKKLVSHWSKLGNDHRDSFKRVLVELFFKESNGLVRKSIAEVIIIVARIEIAIGGWKEFTQFLFSLSTNPDHSIRETQLHIIEDLLSNVSTFSQYSNELLAICKNSLVDPVVSVRGFGLRATGAAILAFTEKSKVIKLFLDLIPSMIEVIKICIQSHMEDEVMSAFEIFDELTMMTPSPIITSIPIICKFSLEIITTQNIEESIKTVSVEYLDTVIKCRPKILTKNNLVHPVMLVLFHILSMEIDEEELETDNNIYQSAGQAVQDCSKSFSGKQVFDPLFPFIKELSENPDPNKRRGAMAIIQQLSYGCDESMKDQLEPVLSIVLRCLTDPHRKVRENALVCIGKLSQNLHPDIYKYSSRILPLLLQTLNDPDDEYILRCCYALEFFLLELEKAHIIPILPEILKSLGLLVQRENIQVKEFSLSTICALAIATELDFQPYFNDVFNLSVGYITLTHPDQHILRANAIDCIASLVKTFPKAQFLPLIPDLFKKVYETVESQVSCEVKESCFSFYTTIFEHFGEELGEFVKLVYPQLHKSATNEDIIIFDKTNNGNSIQAMLDEKNSAVNCMGVMAQTLPKSFFPYCQQTAETLEILCNYLHEDIREISYFTLHCLIHPVNMAFPPTRPPTKGDLGEDQVSEPMKKLLTYSFQLYTHAFTYDENKEVITRVCFSIAKTIQTLGAAPVFPYLQSLCENLIGILQGKLHCQTKYSEDTPDDEDDINEGQQDEDYVDEEDEDEDFRLIEGAAECIIEVALSLGSRFKQYLELILPFLFKLTKPKIHHSMRACIIGALAECIKAIESDFSNHFDALFKLSIQGLTDESSKVKRTSLYLLGVIIKSSVIAKQDHFNLALQKISPIIMNSQNESEEVIDNAIGCLSRLILTNYSFVPVDQILPVYLSKLPIKCDLDEIDTVVSTFTLLFNTHFNFMSQYIQKISDIFTFDLQRDKLKPEITNYWIIFG